jgi:hypothetical protein
MKSVFRKHWFDTSCWGIVEVMHVLLEVTKTTFDVANFIVISMDEIIAIDNTQ